MTLIDTERALGLHASLMAPIEMSGGSAANTMCGVASFGGRAAYIGKVAADGLGEAFRHDLHAEGVHFANPLARAEVPTGRCLIVVTPDAQRTMNTFLGVSSLLGPDDVSTEVVTSGQVVYMEGYLYDRPEAKQAYRKAAEVAHRAGRKVSLTLSDSFCVERHRDDFLALVRDEVDLLFSNASELCALYQRDRLADALDEVHMDCELAVATTGPEGSVVVTADDLVYVKAEPVRDVVDTTGAGDLYAAGFLYGYTQGAELAECGRLGSVAAAEVIGHVGARPLVPLRRLR
jgi:sugar/nucleoside kinase (ribokinase family)